MKNSNKKKLHERCVTKQSQKPNQKNNKIPTIVSNITKKKEKKIIQTRQH